MFVLTIIGVGTAIMLALGVVGAGLQRHRPVIFGVGLGWWFWLLFACLCIATAAFALLGQGQLAFFGVVAALVCGSLALGPSVLLAPSLTNVAAKVAVFCLVAAPLAFLGAYLLFVYMWSFAEAMP